jgi:hypothetical protein
MANGTHIGNLDFEPLTTRHRLVLLAIGVFGAIVIALGAAHGPAQAGSPAPAYKATCVAGGLTTTTWQHMRVTSFAEVWFDDTDLPIGSWVNSTSSSRAKGQLQSSTPAYAASVRVKLTTAAGDTTFSAICA